MNTDSKVIGVLDGKEWVVEDDLSLFDLNNAVNTKTSLHSELTNLKLTSIINELLAVEFLTPDDLRKYSAKDIKFLQDIYRIARQVYVDNVENIKNFRECIITDCVLSLLECRFNINLIQSFPRALLEKLIDTAVDDEERIRYIEG